MEAARVVISLTTISSRIATLHVTIASLLEQDYPNFEVRLYTSEEPYLLDEGIKTLPPEMEALLASSDRLSWHRVRNMGPYRKLLPVLAELYDDDVIIVTADDDTIYPTGWLSSLVYFNQKFNTVTCLRGHTIAVNEGGFQGYRQWMTRGVSVNPGFMLLPTGKDGVLYRTSYFHPKVFDYATACSIAPTTDDLWFRWHTAATGVEVYCIEADYKAGSLAVTGSGPSLYGAFNSSGGNDTAVTALHRYAKEVLQFDLISEGAAHAGDA